MSKKDKEKGKENKAEQKPDSRQEPVAEQPESENTPPQPEPAPEVQAEQPATAQEPEEPAPEEKKEEPSETEKLKATLAEANDKYLRMLAEYDNYRRRSQKERENIYADVKASTVLKFLPVYDNLARALQHEKDEEARKGFEGIFNQLKSILAGLGVTEIETVGKKFDANLHDALLHIEDEKYGEGEIVMELEKGFKLGDKVIRFAKVQVAN